MPNTEWLGSVIVPMDSGAGTEVGANRKSGPTGQISPDSFNRPSDSRSTRSIRSAHSR